MYKLKAGYRARTRNGKMWVVLPGDMVRHCGTPLDGMILAYEDGYTGPVFGKDNPFDIIALYDIPQAGSFAINPRRHGSLLWEESAERKESLARLQNMRAQVENLEREIAALETELQ